MGEGRKGEGECAGLFCTSKKKKGGRRECLGADKEAPLGTHTALEISDVGANTFQ